MRINRITIDNFQGVRAAQIALATPVALIAGPNGAGKSSIAEAVRLALLGAPERVGLKKELPLLVTDGAKLGSVALELDTGPVSFTLPKGTADGDDAVPQSPALPFVLAPETFAAAAADDRRKLLFGLTGTRISPDEIEKRLLARGCVPALVTQIKPILRTGFGPGAEFARQQATQAKGAWRAATGETYGEKKARDWAAEIPPFDRVALERASADLTALDERIAAANQSLGHLAQKAEAYAAARDQIAARRARAAKLPALRQKLEFDLAEHSRAVAHVDALQAKAGAGPRHGLIHDLARATGYLLSYVNLDDLSDEDCAAQDALRRYEAQYGKLNATGDAEAAAALPKAIEARDLMARSVENDRRDIAAAEEAAASLDGATAPEAVERADVEAVRARLAALQAERKSLDAVVQGLLNAKRAAVSAAERTANAARYHQEVLAWGAIADALSPDGIPGEILAEVLQPFNATLAELAELAGWLSPAVAGDMTITWGGRPYRLLSESERWRVDALIGAALAEISGLRCLVLDRFDCLDLPGRGDALGLVDALADERNFDTIVLLGTLKAPPAAPTELFTVFWIDHGHAGQQAMREAA